MALITSFVIVLLNYWREIRTKRESEIYLRKTKFYEELIECLNRIVFQEDPTNGRAFGKLYHKTFVYSDKRVIDSLNEFLGRFREKRTLPFKEYRDVFAKILFECRNDLGFKGIVEYKPHYKSNSE